MAPAPSLAQERFRLFLRQLEQRSGRGYQTEVAEALGVHQASISKIALGERNAGIELIEGAVRRFGASWYFFSTKRLPDGFEYDHVPPTGERGDRDEERSPYPAFEAVILELRERDAITPYQVTELRKVRYSAGEDRATPEAARDELVLIHRKQLGEAVTAAASAPSRLERLEAEGKKKRKRR